MTASAFEPEAVLRMAQEDMANGQLDAALAKCMQVLSVQPRHAAALCALGNVLYLQGRYEEAVRVYNALTVLEPMVAGHWQNLGTALRPIRQYDQAIAAFDRALRLAPPSAFLLYNLGVLQMDRCDYGAAHLALRDAVRLAPADATIRWAFAQCCYDIVQLDESLAALEGWQKLDGLSVEITARITLLLVMLGAMEQALPAIEKLLANPPQRGRAALILASTLERLQRVDEARALAERLERDDPSLNTDPERIMLMAVLAERGGRHEDAYRHMSSVLQSQRELVHRHHVLFPFAKVCDELARYDEAWAAAEEAHRSQLAYLEATVGKSSPTQSQILARIEKHCHPADVASWGNDGPSMQESPIFIVGFPRSGTTLLEQVLDAHPMLQSMDEQPFMLKVLDGIAARNIAYPNELGKLTHQACDELRALYWGLVRKKTALRPDQRLVDKYPVNMTLLPLIRRLFPRARIILAIRHPCDTLLSCFLQDFRSPELALLCGDLATLANAYTRVFNFWYSQWPLLSPASYELRYEQLTADFTTEVHKLAEFLQLPWDDAMLTPGDHARAKGFISTPSYSQVTKPINTRSVGRWKNYAGRFTPVLPVLAPWLRRWGYT
ncbi:MAG TPA: sulfotransferase [Steroidobacteraceae bacterium]